jgi:hypothetical protein
MHRLHPALLVLLTWALAAGTAWVAGADGQPTRAEAPPQVALIARIHAAALGNANPTSAGFVETTEQKGLAVLRGRPAVYPPGPPAFPPSVDGPAFLVVLTGHFSGLQRPVPLGTTAPGGSVFSMLIAADSVNGFYFPVEGTENIADSLPDLSGIGPLTPLELPAPFVAPTPTAATCATWTGRAVRLTSRIARLRAVAAGKVRSLSRQRADAAADRLTRSRLGYLVLLRQLCARSPWQAVSFTLQEQAGPLGASVSLTIVNGPQATALAALLPIPLPPAIADPACVVRPLGPQVHRPTPRLLSITLSDGGSRLVQTYPTCNLPSPLEPVRSALGYIADPCECAHG